MSLSFSLSLSQLREGSKNLNLTAQEVAQLQRNFEATVIKLLYGFIWQECVITDDPIIADPDLNLAGAQFLPVVNAFANSLSDFPIYEQNLQVGQKFPIQSVAFPLESVNDRNIMLMCAQYCIR